MSQIDYRGVKFTLSDNEQWPSFYVFGVRRSGSSVFSNMASVLAKIHGYGVVDFGRMFEVGLIPRDWRFDPALPSVVRGGNVYTGFRDFPAALQSDPRFIASRKVLLVRDPRDTLVSEFFSNAYSHPVPPDGPAREFMLWLRSQAQNGSLETQVLSQAPHLRRTLKEYVPLLADPLLKLYRYEDVIMDKRHLLESISIHFGWPIDPQGIGQILKWADVVPPEERPTEFIRRVHPGDHKNKLTEKTIEELNKILAEPMKAFGYAH
jgi:hypothetical protein